jgi:hypothetical protein
MYCIIIYSFYLLLFSKHLKSRHESFLREAAAAACGIIAAMQALRGPPGHCGFHRIYKEYQRVRLDIKQAEERLGRKHLLSLSFNILNQRLLGSSVCHSYLLPVCTSAAL